MPPRNVRKKAPPSGFEKLLDVLNDLARKMKEAEAETTDFIRTDELLWPILRITHQKSRYVWQMFKSGNISQQVLDYCIDNKIVDGTLISKWKKPGFEHLCCTQCAQSFQHGTVCICRAPKSKTADRGLVECRTCGCRGCVDIPSAKKTQKQQEQQHKHQLDQENQKQCDSNELDASSPTTTTTTITTTTSSNNDESSKTEATNN